MAQSRIGTLAQFRLGANIYLPQAVQSGYRLANEAPLLWDAFLRLHNKHGLRLVHHQINSAPVMTGLHDWMTARLTLREVEPNSGLGEAIGYLIKHWQALTRFLHCKR